MVKTKRPVDLPLLKIRLPIGGVISIIHRVTGALLVLVLPLVTYWIDRSLDSPQGFDETVKFLASPVAKLVTVLILVIFIQHLVSGIRHLLLDLQIGMNRAAARKSAWAVPILTLVLTLISAWVIYR
ncbi:MAG: succinate dehydrogenase, cytochrome b556 subunit [Acidiferrobacterales bacterium]